MILNMEEEYASHIGWGYATFEHAINAVNGVDVKKAGLLS